MGHWQNALLTLLFTTLVAPIVVPLPKRVVPAATAIGNSEMLKPNTVRFHAFPLELIANRAGTITHPDVIAASFLKSRGSNLSRSVGLLAFDTSGDIVGAIPLSLHPKSNDCCTPSPATFSIS